jgi:DNA-binding NtrC family response regulator
MTGLTDNDISTARILLVDDEETILEIVGSILRGAGFECREAANGLQALQLLRDGEKFDLMLTDTMMSGLDGIGLLERTRVEFPEMPVVMGSALHDLSVILTCLRKGACDYLLYPFNDREELLDMVRRALEHDRANKEHKVYVANLEAQIVNLTEQLRIRTT